MNAEHARQVIDAFWGDGVPSCDAAVTDDGTMLGFEWAFGDGRMLIVDIYDDGRVTASWRNEKS